MKVGGHFTPHTKESKIKISLNRKGKGLNERNGNWRGDKVGYNALHTWVHRRCGEPTTCEKCGKRNLFGKKIHWANKSGKYLRKMDDWLRLCAKCHLDYDGYKRWIGHIKNSERKCPCGRVVKARNLCSFHYNKLNLQERGIYA